MDCISIAKLIKIIQEHSILYDTSNKDYYDRIKRKRLWEEVCASLHPAWDTADEVEKALYGKEVQKKWQSLRDCFRRELSSQKNGQKKKAQYKYFEELKFLIPFTQSSNSDNLEQDCTLLSMQDIESTTDSKDPLTDSDSRKRKRIRSFRSDEESSILTGIRRTTESTAGEEIAEPREVLVRDGSNRYLDDDEAFLMSLLPGFKEYSWEGKCLLRIDIMKTMLKFKQAQREQMRFTVSVKAEIDEDEETI